jgi:hypothetical protein
MQNDVILIFRFGPPSIHNFLVFVFVLFLIFEIVSCHLIFLICNMLRKNSHSLSRQTYKLQIQIISLLTAQVLTPLFWMFFPVVSVICIVLFQIITTKGVAETLTIAIMLYGFTNSLLTISFVGHYRRHFLDSIVFRLLRLLSWKHGISNRVHELPVSTILNNDMFNRR